MKSKWALVGAAACVALSANVANAAMYYFDFSASGVTATGTLDVVGGQAISGTGLITDPSFWTGADPMTLVTLSTPGVNNLGGGNLSYRFGGGTDLIGDTVFPIDGNGLVFTVANSSNPSLDLGFNIWSNGGGSYTGFLAGNGGIYNGYNGTFVSSVPEPATWVMMMLGFAGLGIAGFRRTKKSNVLLAAV